MPQAAYHLLSRLSSILSPPFSLLVFLLPVLPTSHHLYTGLWLWSYLDQEHRGCLRSSTFWGMQV